MPVAQTRRELFGGVRGGGVQHRPPWARDEYAFTEACTQCGKCQDACPQEIIIRGHAGYPIISFSKAGCTFCGGCAEACEADCFIKPSERTGKPWTLYARVSTACVEAKGVACRMCYDACEYDALRFRPKLGGGANLIIDEDCCTGCGVCVSHCPVGALSMLEQSSVEVLL